LTLVIKICSSRNEKIESILCTSQRTIGKRAVYPSCCWEFVAQGLLGVFMIQSEIPLIVGAGPVGWERIAESGAAQRTLRTRSRKHHEAACALSDVNFQFRFGARLTLTKGKDRLWQQR
jgi:hypothetical protein